MTTSIKPANHTPTSLAVGTNTPSGRSVTSSAAIALGMSWQLLVVIVLPLVGGHVLDGRTHMSPVWTVVGMVVSLVGTIVVVRQAMQQLNDVMELGTKEPK